MKTYLGHNTVDAETISVRYLNEANRELVALVPINTLQNYEMFKNELVDTVNKITLAQEQPIQIKYVDDFFTVSGMFKQAVLMKYTDLEQADKEIIDAIKAKVYDVLREEFTNMSAILTSGKVTVNSIEYDYSVFQGQEFDNGIELALRLLN